MCKSSNRLFTQPEERDEGVTARRSEAVKFPTIIHAIFEMAPRSGAR
jgi:hypothetical protein